MQLGAMDVKVMTEHDHFNVAINFFLSLIGTGKTERGVARHSQSPFHTANQSGWLIGCLAPPRDKESFHTFDPIELSLRPNQFPMARVFQVQP